jgi:hypothetical protein
MESIDTCLVSLLMLAMMMTSVFWLFRFLAESTPTRRTLSISPAVTTVGSGVGVKRGVGVRVGVRVGVTVCVGVISGPTAKGVLTSVTAMEGVSVGVDVGVKVGVAVGLGVVEGTKVGTAVALPELNVAVAVARGREVIVAEGLGVELGEGVGVRVGAGVSVSVSVGLTLVGDATATSAGVGLPPHPTRAFPRRNKQQATNKRLGRVPPRVHFPARC